MGTNALSWHHAEKIRKSELYARRVAEAFSAVLKRGSGLNFKRNGLKNGRLRCVWGNSPCLRRFTSEKISYRKLSHFVLSRKQNRLIWRLHSGRVALQRMVEGWGHLGAGKDRKEGSGSRRVQGDHDQNERGWVESPTNTGSGARYHPQRPCY